MGVFIVFSAICNRVAKSTDDTALRIPSLRLPEPISRAFSTVWLSSITERSLTPCAPSLGLGPVPILAPPRLVFDSIIWSKILVFRLAMKEPHAQLRRLFSGLISQEWNGGFYIEHMNRATIQQIFLFQYLNFEMRTGRKVREIRSFYDSLFVFRWSMFELYMFFKQSQQLFLTWRKTSPLTCS